jgi:hypothetical protein
MDCRPFLTSAFPAFTGAVRSGLCLLFLSLFVGGCAQVRVTDPPRTATEQFLISGSIADAVADLSMDGLRDQLVFVDATYLVGDPGSASGAQIVQHDRPGQDYLFLLGEVRAKMLKEGVRITSKRDEAAVIVEVRSGGVGIDRYEFLLGFPSVTVSNVTGSGASAGIPIATPEISLLKSSRQRAFSSVAIVAYRNKANSGEMVSQSGPFVGRRYRGDYWILGTGPNTVGDIPPAERSSADRNRGGSTTQPSGSK